MNINTGCIYGITCKINSKSYIGQARDFKLKNGKPFHYGIKGRWSDHISSSKTPKTPFQQAINKYGKKNFIRTVLKRCKLSDLDAWEAKIIAHNNTVYPNGYNVAKHSRVKNRDKSNIGDYYICKTLQVEINPIKKNGCNKLVYIYLTLTGENDKTRITFGQGKNSSFEQALKEAYEFIEPFKNRNIPIKINHEILGNIDPLAKYKDKIEKLTQKNIKKIIISKNKQGEYTLIIVYVFHDDVSNKIKIAFGGKLINPVDAYKIATMFVQKIKNNSTKVEETNCLTTFLKSATGSCL